MKMRADLTVKEVGVPSNLFCRSGHIAPTVFQRDPPHPAEPTRFFNVNSDVDPNVNGVYCEPCLIVANALARHQKK